MSNQATVFVSSSGESRNPLYEGQFDGETAEQAAHRLHWARAVYERNAFTHDKWADKVIAMGVENGQLKTRAASLEGALQDSREMYEQMEDTLDKARAVLSADPVTHECLVAQCNQLLRSYDGAVGKPLATEVVGWQFYQDGKWLIGTHHNRAKMVSGGIPTRNVYAGCKVANVRPVLSAAAFKKELLAASKSSLHPHIEGVYAVFELQQESV